MTRRRFAPRLRVCISRMLLIACCFCFGHCLESVDQQDSMGQQRQQYVCPSNCSNKGRCVMGQCYCLFGYTGENCAIVSETVTLKPGRSYKAHIASKSWRYFTVDVADMNPGHLKVELIALANATFNGVSHHGFSHGLELRSQLALFVNELDRPSETEFKSRCLRRMACADSNKLELRVEEPQGSTWWIGVRSGLKDEYFSIGVDTPIGLCSDSCSGRGTCLRNRCCCQPGSKGRKCEEIQSSKTMPIGMNSEVAGNVLRDTWRYYFLSQIQAVSAVYINLRILSFSTSLSPGVTEAIHLVASKSDIPSTSANRIAEQYEYSCKITKQPISDSTSAECTVRIDKPGPFAWFVGILADGLEGNYILETKSVERCPYECSFNGKCNASLGRCFCHGTYTGEDCSQVNSDFVLPLESRDPHELKPNSSQLQSRPQGFSLLGNEVKYHKVVIPKQFSGNLDIIVQNFKDLREHYGAQPISIHLAVGVLPTTASFVLHKVFTGSRAELSLSPFQKDHDQLLWIRVQSTSAVLYEIAAKSSDTQCKHDCNGQGFCSKGVCHCHPGFAGISCGYHLSTALAPPLSQEVGLNHIQIQPYRWVALDVNEKFTSPKKSSSTYFHLAIELESTTVSAVERALASKFSCVDIAAVVYNNEQIENLAFDEQRHDESACHFQLPLTEESFTVSRIELIWQYNDFSDVLLDASEEIRAGGESSIQAKFRVEYDLVVECPNRCSGAGICNKGACICNHDRIGEDCSQVKPQLIAYENLGPIKSEKYDTEHSSSPEDEGSHTVATALDAEERLDSDLEDSGFIKMDKSAMYNGYTVLGGIFFLILCLTVYMRYSSRQRDTKVKEMRPPDSHSRSCAPLLPIDEEENYSESLLSNNQFGSPKTTLKDIQLPLPLPVVMKGIRQRKTMPSWGVLSDVQNSNSFVRTNSFGEDLVLQAECAPPSHISIQLNNNP